jgi:tRNA nucleotidyltransferase (CCA-adding enzyme)
MSDYMFVLESRLGADQNRVVAEVQTAAAEANTSLFLTGGAMRDMLGGFPIRDLDFTVESTMAPKIAKAVAKKTGARVAEEDEHRKSVELAFPGGATAEVAMASQQQYSKPGGRPQVTPATIHEDLRYRDFTVNAIALSLNRASRGLLIDPTNGLGDLERKELRTAYSFALYDDPSRILRLIRLKARLGFTIEERTQQQYENVRAEKLEEKIPPARLLEEIRRIAEDPNPGDILQALEEAKLLHLFSPAFAGTKLNLAGFAKLHKAKQLIPAGIRFPVDNFGLFMNVLTEKLSTRERSEFVHAVGMRPPDTEAWQKLETRSKKLEKDLKSPKLTRPSQLYHVVSGAPGDQVLFLLLRSDHRLVQDRIRNYFQKHLPLAQEVTDEEVRAKGVEPGTPKYEKAKEELIAAKLNARPKKPTPEELAAAANPPAPPSQPGGLRRAYSRQPTAR